MFYVEKIIFSVKESHLFAEKWSGKTILTAWRCSYAPSSAAALSHGAAALGRLSDVAEFLCAVAPSGSP